MYSCVHPRWLLKDEHGRLTKEKARACIDGSIWYQLAAENEHRQVRSSMPALHFGLLAVH